MSSSNVDSQQVASVDVSSRSTTPTTATDTASRSSKNPSRRGSGVLSYAVNTYAAAENNQMYTTATGASRQHQRRSASQRGKPPTVSTLNLQNSDRSRLSDSERVEKPNPAAPAVEGTCGEGEPGAGGDASTTHETALQTAHRDEQGAADDGITSWQGEQPDEAEDREEAARGARVEAGKGYVSPGPEQKRKKKKKNKTTKKKNGASVTGGGRSASAGKKLRPNNTLTLSDLFPAVVKPRREFASTDAYNQYIKRRKVQEAGFHTKADLCHHRMQTTFDCSRSFVPTVHLKAAAHPASLGEYFDVCLSVFSDACEVSMSNDVISDVISDVGKVTSPLQRTGRTRTTRRVSIPVLREALSKLHYRCGSRSTDALVTLLSRYELIKMEENNFLAISGVGGDNANPEESPMVDERTFMVIAMNPDLFVSDDHVVFQDVIGRVDACWDDTGFATFGAISRSKFVALLRQLNLEAKTEKVNEGSGHAADRGGSQNLGILDVANDYVEPSAFEKRLLGEARCYVVGRVGGHLSIPFLAAIAVLYPPLRAVRHVQS